MRDLHAPPHPPRRPWLIVVAGAAAAIAVGASLLSLRSTVAAGDAALAREEAILARQLAAAVEAPLQRAEIAAETLPVADLPADRAGADRWLGALTAAYRLEPWVDVQLEDRHGRVRAAVGGPHPSHPHTGEGVLACPVCLVEDGALVVRADHAGGVVEIRIDLDRLEAGLLSTAATAHGVRGRIAGTGRGGPPTAGAQRAPIEGAPLEIILEPDQRATRAPLRDAVGRQTLGVAATFAALGLLMALLVREQRRQAAAERHAMQTQLEHERAEAHTRRLATLGQLTAGVAHELNNPLTAVLASLELLDRRGEGIGPEHDLAELTASARDGAHRMRDIIRAMRRFAHHSDAPVSAVEVAGVIRAAEALTRPLTHAAGGVVLELEPTPPVAAREPELVQILVNLIGNAADAVPAAHAGRGAITVRNRVRGDHVELEVTDRGPGFSPDALDHAFEPFFTTKPVGDGTGLGLSICHGLVRAIGGAIVIRNGADGGAQVTVSLPIHRSVPAELTARRPRVLVIDDEPAVARAIARLLSPRAQVEVAGGGRAALELLLHDSAYELVLCDVRMPDLDGPGLRERILRLRPALAARFVFLTGDVHDPRLRGLGAPIRMIEKPCSRASLLAVLAAQPPVGRAPLLEGALDRAP